MANEQRKGGSRLRVWGTIVLYRSEPAAANDERLAAVEDAGPGGVFIAIREPPPVGAWLQLRLFSQAGPPGRSAVGVRAIVCWRRVSGEPRGAGVKFSEFVDGERGRSIWLTILETAIVARGSRVPAPQPAGQLARGGAEAGNFDLRLPPLQGENEVMLRVSYRK
jgi:hypothetical protein